MPRYPSEKPPGRHGVVKTRKIRENIDPGDDRHDGRSTGPASTLTPTLGACRQIYSSAICDSDVR